jgi:hypothetical protein
VTYIVKAPPITTDANKMTSLETYLCAFKMFHAKIYLWHLQAFLISGAKIKKINYILIEV